MRNFTLTNTNCTVFGMSQDRVVMANGEGCAPARTHLSRASRAHHASWARITALVLKRWVVEAVTGAVQIIGIYLPIAGPQLCRQPVQSSRLHASVRA
jgi:hypothetical protein